MARTEQAHLGPQEATPEHTPGPWHLSVSGASNTTTLDRFHPERECPYGGGGWDVRIKNPANDRGIINICHGNWNDYDRDQKLANARLIAAAPDLLEALQRIADESIFNQQRFAEDTDADYFLRCFGAVKERARAAIAKATSQ